MILHLITLCLIGLTYGQQDDESCFVEGQCTFSTSIGDAITSNEKECLRLCKNTPGDVWNLWFFLKQCLKMYYLQIVSGLHIFPTEIFAHSSKTVWFWVKRVVTVKKSLLWHWELLKNHKFSSKDVSVEKKHARFQIPYVLPRVNVLALLLS